MDFSILSEVIGEASGLVTGARVDRLYEAESRDIIILLRNAGRQFILLVSPDRSLPRIHLISRKPPAGSALHPFTLYLRSRVIGGKVETIRILNRDRIVEIVFYNRGKAYRLLIELFGSAANLILTDRDGIIQTVYYPSMPDGGRNRLLMPGILYTPPDQTRFSATARAETGTRAGTTTADDAPASPNQQAETSFQMFLDRRQFEALKAKLLAAARKASGRIERRLEALGRDRGHSERAEEYRRCGDLILANLQDLRTGMKQADLPGRDGTGGMVLLDPRRSPTENAELYYRRYKKAKAGRTVIETRSAEARAELARTESLLLQVKNATRVPELSSLQAEFFRSGLLHLAQGKQPKVAAASSDPYRKVSFRGWEILVGRNARGNDYLTTKMARANDLWLHAEGMPGSHVLIRNPDAVEIPPPVLERAASLAAYHSRGRAAGKVPVTYTFARSVKKPKGAKPGLVTLSERKTIVVVPQGDQENE
jgi:predicted ribosome quality control (RQC) complex YloA/Tae2 family protein